MSKIKGVSLFSNVGIAETYLDNTNIEIVVANELLRNRADFYSYLYPKVKMIQGDIQNNVVFNDILKEAKKENCKFVLITPPCQGMSVAGKMDKNDPRNSLIIKAIEFVLELKPDYVLIENVPGILKTSVVVNNEFIKVVDFIKESLNGYFINYKIVDASDYGTPQFRKRAIFLISKIHPWSFPNKMDKITVRDAIEYLPSLESGQKSSIKYHYAKVHNNMHIECMMHTKTGETALNNKIFYPKKNNGEKIKGYSTTYKRIEWDKPAPTITMANGSISSQNNVHPGRLKKDGSYSDARVLTLKEIFILTGLPDNWNPPPWASDNLTRQVIGEGIPPKLLLNLIKTIQ